MFFSLLATNFGTPCSSFDRMQGFVELPWKLCQSYIETIFRTKTERVVICMPGQ